MCLHDSNRGEYDDLARLQSQWVNVLAADKKDIGGIMIDAPYIDGDDVPPVYKWPWCQPLNEIRNYFGEEVRAPPLRRLPS